jgi:uncharacterized damage-inducible protein DinB
MFSRIDDFEQVWTQEREATRKYLNALTDESLTREVAPEDRTLGRIAWHIVTSIPEMMRRTGLAVTGAEADSPLPGTAAGTAAAYDQISASLLDQVRTRWDDEALQVEDDMYGEKWKRGLTLRILIDHQTHHRGQMSVLMRQAGLKVPGIYGPSREEWAGFGMKAPEI